MRVQFRTTFADVIRFIWIHLTRSAGFLLFPGAMALFVTWNVCHSTFMQHSRLVGTIASLLTAAIIFVGIFLISFLASIFTALSPRNKTFMTDNTAGTIGAARVACGECAVVPFTLKHSTQSSRTDTGRPSRRIEPNAR